MNIKRFLIPASLAAVFHAALLSLPEEKYVRILEVPLKPVTGPDRPEDKVPSPPEETSQDSPTVASLPGGDVLPEIEPPPFRDRTSPFVVTEIEALKHSEKTVTILKDRPGIEGRIGNGDFSGPEVPGLFRSSDLDRIPSARSQPAPLYPPGMSREGVSGHVMVEFDVNAEGRVTRAVAVEYNRREFAEPAERAVMKWRFEPGRRHGRAVAFRMTVPIEFGLGRD